MSHVHNWRFTRKVPCAVRHEALRTLTTCLRRDPCGGFVEGVMSKQQRWELQWPWLWSHCHRWLLFCKSPGVLEKWKCYPKGLTWFQRLQPWEVFHSSHHISETRNSPQFLSPKLLLYGGSWKVSYRPWLHSGSEKFACAGNSAFRTKPSWGTII